MNMCMVASSDPCSGERSSLLPTLSLDVSMDNGSSPTGTACTDE
jgi:hypothetical protein